MRIEEEILDNFYLETLLIRLRGKVTHFIAVLDFKKVATNYLTFGGPLHNPEYDHIVRYFTIIKNFWLSHGLLLIIKASMLWFLENVKKLYSMLVGDAKVGKSNRGDIDSARYSGVSGC